MTNENTLKQHDPQVKPPEITKQVERLHVTAKTLEESIGMLEDRLRPVLAERNVGNGTGVGAPEPVRVPLAEELHTANGAFERLRERIGSITARLEI